MPLPSHHGHVTSWAVPPRLETTVPVPRHGGQGICAWRAARRSTRRPRLAAPARPIVSMRAVQRSHDGRFAPSPTGPLHLGNLRTALLAWLFARAGGGRFLIRVEDLDAARSRPEHEAGQLADLAALGLDSDEPLVRQSERTALYDDAIARLDREGALYRCWCTRAEIREAASAPHGPLPEGAYPGTCRDLTRRAERRARAQRAPAGAAARRRRGPHRVHRPPARAARGRRRRPRRAPQRRRPRLQPRGRRRRRRPGASARSSAARISSTPPPASCYVGAPARACGEPTLRARPAHARARRRAPGQAPRRGDARRPRRARRDAAAGPLRARGERRPRRAGRGADPRASSSTRLDRPLVAA